MATRSNIAVYLKESDRNKLLNYLDERFEGNRAKIQCSDARKPKDEPMSEIYENIITSDNVLMIYSHHDGYPEHMFEELNNNFNSYEKALSLILAGSTSGVYDGESLVYSLGKGEEYDSPWSVDFDHITVDEAYLYIFKDGHWQWALDNGYYKNGKYVKNNGPLTWRTTIEIEYGNKQ